GARVDGGFGRTGERAPRPGRRRADRGPSGARLFAAVKRVILAVLFVLGLAGAGGVSAGVGSTTTSTGTTTDPQVIAAGVTIGGVAVGGMTADEADAAVTDAFEQPLQLLVLRHKLFVKPARLGTTAL